MKKILLNTAGLFLMMSLAACSSMTSQNTSSATGNRVGTLSASPQTAEPVTAMNTEKATNASLVGGRLASSMDSVDKAKLSKALDNALGKTSHWTNVTTGINYTVTPIKKITLNNNPYCREYNLIAAKGNKTQEITGTACVAADSTWQAVR